ncbi:succinate dehydrogenase, cytochrome b556 subunit [Simplicispira psychrophila]|uniref:succinate dehydrogenase, cytochrome b556 subunit n=1 Tax=Simplicispira psychrophila TaxID=80882 RepID=UPI000482A0F0|nr:succinate dehydrogenase, cytochrome b556 subunit [Simplicispira psychrophila]
MQKPPTRILPRPMFLNLLQIRMPVGAITSILHRLSGVLLAVGVPLCLTLLWRSLDSEAGFAQVMALLHHRIFQGMVIVLVWALAHHLLAGVRHMLTDINIGSTLHTARRSAWTVNMAGALVALLALGALP